MSVAHAFCTSHKFRCHTRVSCGHKVQIALTNQAINNLLGLALSFHTSTHAHTVFLGRWGRIHFARCTLLADAFARSTRATLTFVS